MFKFSGIKKRLIVNLFVTLFLGSITSINVYAESSSGSEHGEPTKSDEHAPSAEKSSAEGHGGGNDGKEKKADLPPWTEIQNKISQLEAKMQQKKDNLEKLIEEKQKVNPQSPRVKEIIDMMIKEHKEYQSLSQDYEKTITILKFRFPERGAKTVRKYVPMEMKSLEEMEKELSTEGRLHRNMKKMRKQYFVEKSKTIEEPKKSSTQEVRPKEKSLEESGTIILQK